MSLTGPFGNRSNDINTGLSSLTTGASLPARTDVARVLFLTTYDDGFTGSFSISNGGLTWPTTPIATTIGLTNGPSSPIVTRVFLVEGSPTAGTLTISFIGDTMDYAEISVVDVVGSAGAVAFEGVLVPFANGVQLAAANDYDFIMDTSGGGAGNGLLAYATCADDTDDWTIGRTGSGWSSVQVWDTADALVFQAEAISFNPGDDSAAEFEKTATSDGQYATGLVLEFSEGSGGTLQAVGLITEASHALGVGAAKALEAGQPAEDDDALAATSSSAIVQAIGLPAEDDDGLAAAVGKSLALGQPAEEGLALDASSAKEAAIGLPAEDDAGVVVGRLKEATLGLAAADEDGLAVAHSRQLGVGLPLEEDAALGVVLSQLVQVGLLTEGSVALAVVAGKALAVGLATEGDEARSGPGIALDGASDWGAALGTSALAVLDDGWWTDLVGDFPVGSTGGVPYAEVEDSSGLGFPPALDQVLRTILFNQPHSAPVRKENYGAGEPTITAPAVGEYFFQRVYFRIDAEPGDNIGNLHWLHYGGGGGYMAWWSANPIEVSPGVFEISPDGEYYLAFQFHPNGAGEGPGIWYGGILEVLETYRLEVRMLRETTTTYSVELRIYDSADTLLYDNSTLTDNSTGNSLAVDGTELETTTEEEADDVARYFQIGTNDSVEPGGMTNIGALYTGAFAVHIGTDPNAWIGAYQAGEEEGAGGGGFIVKSLAVGQSVEDDEALAITSSAAIVQAVGQVAEDSLARAVGRLKELSLGLAQTDVEALGVVVATGTPVGVATESDVALASSWAKALGVQIVAEGDGALDVTPVRVRAVGLNTEGDDALAVAVATSTGLGLALETDLGRIIVPAKSLEVGRAAETDSALALFELADGLVLVLSLSAAAPLNLTITAVPQEG